MILIAEAKHASPYTEINNGDFEEALATAIEHGDWVSVLVDEEWGGNVSDLAVASTMTDKPILAKGFHPTVASIQRSLNYGADYVLCVGWMPPLKYQDKVLVEAETYGQVERWARLGYAEDVKLVWNNRNPRTGVTRYGGLRPENVEVLRGLWGGWFCTASGYDSPDQLPEGVDAVLVGEHLKEFVGNA